MSTHHSTQHPRSLPGLGRPCSRYIDTTLVPQPVFHATVPLMHHAKSCAGELKRHRRPDTERARDRKARSVEAHKHESSHNVGTGGGSFGGMPVPFIRAVLPPTPGRERCSMFNCFGTERVSRRLRFVVRWHSAYRCDRTLLGEVCLVAAQHTNRLCSVNGLASNVCWCNLCVYRLQDKRLLYRLHAVAVTHVLLHMVYNGCGGGASCRCYPRCA